MQIYFSKSRHNIRAFYPLVKTFHLFSEKYFNAVSALENRTPDYAGVPMEREAIQFSLAT